MQLAILEICPKYRSLLCWILWIMSLVHPSLLRISVFLILSHLVTPSRYALMNRSYLTQRDVLTQRDSPDLDSLLSDSDELLFDRINHNTHTLQQYLPARPDLNYSLRSRHHNKTLCVRLLNWMTEILLLEIYTNIAINCHDTCCYLISLIQLQPLFRISAFLYILLLWH